MMDSVMGGGSGFGLMGTLNNLLILVDLSATIVWVVVRVLPARRAQGEPSEGRADSAEELLRGRFARGKIDTEEYERSLEMLRGKPKERTYQDIVREATRQSTRELPRRE